MVYDGFSVQLELTSKSFANGLQYDHVRQGQSVYVKNVHTYILGLLLMGRDVTQEHSHTDQ